MKNCKKEGCKGWVVNQKYSLCDKHNKERLHPNQEYYQQKSFSTTKSNWINPISKNQLQLKKNLHQIYDEIDSEREHICESCGNSQQLSHSHIISRKKRKDLETDKENIKLHCLQPCHENWESGDIEKMLENGDFIQNMEYIKKKDINYYNLLQQKLEEYLKTIF